MAGQCPVTWNGCQTLYRKEDNSLAIIIQLSGGFLDVREFAVDGGEGGVAEGVGARDVGRDVFVGLGEVGEEGLAEFGIGRLG